MENVIYSILLAFHNIALVGCVAGPFYMGRIVRARSRHERKIVYPMDTLMEDVITSQPVICWLMIILLYVTGIGFPVVYVLFHGYLKDSSTTVLYAFWVKQALILGIVAILFYGTFFVNPRLEELFARFKDGKEPDPDDEKEFFRLRSLRKKWCDRCLALGILVLLVSPVLRWF